MANLLTTGRTQGGSTITQQLVKNTLLTQEKSYTRKIKEWVLAIKIDKSMSKDKIFEVCNKNLSENGIAYISYNTLPGWNMVRTVRDMMMYHAKGFVSPLDKVAQARALLAFVKESLEGQDTPYAKMLSQEAELLSKQGDHYIRHEHLEDNNNPKRFLKKKSGSGGLNI